MPNHPLQTCFPILKVQPQQYQQQQLQQQLQQPKQLPQQPHQQQQVCIVSFFLSKLSNFIDVIKSVRWKSI